VNVEATRLPFWLTVLVAVAALLVACTSNSGASTGVTIGPSAAASGAVSSGAASAVPSTAAGGLTIFAAASLKDVLAKVKTAYETANPGTTLTISTDSSAALATQIQNGAPADVFLSADTKNPDALATAGLTTGPTTAFAGNTLTVIVPTANPAGITAPADLARAGVKVIAAGDEVPITTYATQAVDRLATVAGYPADFAAKYAANVVSKEENVKAIVGKLELGEGDAGIVYVTDATASDQVTPIEIPAAGNVPATYGAVVVKASPNAAAAQAFLDWLEGAEGQALLATFGFLPPPS
jgi:molybdate transport system substrate-binding protein